MAVYANGVSSGTAITNGGDIGSDGTANNAGDVVMTYLSGIDPRNKTSNNTIISVDKVVGVALTHFTSSVSDGAAMIGDLSATSGATLYFPFKVYNTSNASETISFAAAQTVGSNWTAAILHDTGTIGTYEAGDTTASSSMNLAADGSLNLILSITIAADALDGQSSTKEFRATTATAANFGQYTGANSTVYCRKGVGFEYGAAHATAYTWTANVLAPIIVLAKTIVLTDANSGQTGYVSGASPGDTIEYTIAYTNTGGASATACVIFDRVPANTTFLANGYAGASGIQIDGVTKTNATGDDTADYDTGLVIARIGTGANASAGGTLATATG